MAALVHTGLVLGEPDLGVFPAGGLGKLCRVFTCLDLPDQVESKAFWGEKFWLK